MCLNSCVAWKLYIHRAMCSFIAFLDFDSKTTTALFPSSDQVIYSEEMLHFNGYEYTNAHVPISLKLLYYECMCSAHV